MLLGRIVMVHTISVLLEAPNDQALKDLMKQITDVGNDLKKSNDEVKKTAETALTEAKGLGKITEDTKKSFDELFAKHNGLNDRFAELEQKLARRGKDDDETPLKTIGEAVIEDAGVKAMTSATRGKAAVKLNRKDLMSLSATWGNNTSSSNSLVAATRVPGIVGLPERQLTIRDLLAPGQTNSNMIEYAQETGFTNNARVVSEGQTKPKSDLTFELQTAPVRTIAHIFKASRQILDDAPALRSYIDARARYGLRYAEEAELLTGDGTGQHILGIIPQATAYSAPFTPDDLQRIDTVRLAMLQAALAEFPPTGIVMNPIDWAGIQLTKDGEGRYIIGNPADGNVPRLWNLPIVETQAMEVDTFLTGNFNMAAQIFDRLEIEILLSTENSTDFEKNMVTIRAEERLALAVYRPEAFIYGDFGIVT
jgi:HK97 family phage major capsid protein